MQLDVLDQVVYPTLSYPYGGISENKIQKIMTSNMLNFAVLESKTIAKLLSQCLYLNLPDRETDLNVKATVSITNRCLCSCN